LNTKIWPFLCLMLFVLLGIAVQKTEPGHASGTLIFVSTTGSGTDCSQELPCLPEQGMDNADDGDTIYFKAGTYTGTSDPMFTITKGVSLIGGWDGAATGDVVTDPDEYETELDGEGTRGLFLVDSSSDVYHVSITGFTLRFGRSQFGGAINIKDGKTTIENNSIKSNAATSHGGGIYAEAQDGLVVRNNFFFANSAVNGGGGLRIDRESATEVARIEHNTFLANYITSVGNGGLIEVSNSAAQINANRIAHTSNTSSTILVTSEELAEITNNIIYWDSYDSSNAAAIQVWYEDGEETQIFNNTIINAHVGVDDVSKAKANITNNIFSGCWKSIDMLSEGNFTGTNNLFYNDQAEDPIFLDNPVIDESPLFVDKDNHDFHITKDSPAVDAGAVVALVLDFDGDERPIGNGFDIGADEVRTGFSCFLPLVIH
jgi:hypothetical protein